MKISCLIVDDEPFARKGLAEYVADIGFLELKGSAENALVASGILSENKIDLLFLDVQMPKVTGLEFLKILKEPPMVILTTAYSQYALQGYELDVVDYLVKPISFERFLKACNKAREFHFSKHKAADVIAKKEPYFFIKADNRYEKIEYDDLLFAEAMENYVILHTKSAKHICYITFKAVEDYLPADKFVKAHKSFIVSINKIDNIETNLIRIGKCIIPIGRSFKDEVMKKIVNTKLLKR